jgi:glycogen operon protein
MLFSAGIPMITAGDERAKTQQGNNNAYCQDTAMSWVNWQLTQHQQDFEETVAYLTKLRAEHPALRPPHFNNFEQATENSDLARWYNVFGEVMHEQDWHSAENRSFARLVKSVGERADQLLMVFHATENQIKFTLPTELESTRLELLFDSTFETQDFGQRAAKPGEILTLEPMSIRLYNVL